MESPPAIVALPGGVRSGYTISSFSQAVEQCVANALDAEATEIHVEIDLSAFSFRVTDNGRGIPYEHLAQLPCMGATARQQRSLVQLGFRGETLAALSALSSLAITSRAARSFETYTKVMYGSKAATFGLALEQRSRQGTVVSCRDLFYTAPVRRKALLSGGLSREAERCRDRMFRLALVRPEVLFALFDQGHKSFLLRLPKGRAVRQSVSEALGQPLPEALAEVQPTTHAGVTVSGLAALPPQGHANASRQFVYVNGLPVRAALVCKAVDALFGQLYKANARLGPDGLGGEQRKQGNRHAQFLLEIQCGPDAYAMGSELEWEEVAFRDEDAVLAAVKLAVLRAWRPALTLACLKQLEQLESMSGGWSSPRQTGESLSTVAAAPTAGAAAGSFQGWATGQVEGVAQVALPGGSGGRNQAGAAQAAPADSGSARSSWGRRGGGGRSGGAGQRRLPALGGMKHTLASRIVSSAVREGPAESVALGERAAKRLKGPAGAGPTPAWVDTAGPSGAASDCDLQQAWRAQQDREPCDSPFGEDVDPASWRPSATAAIAPPPGGKQQRAGLQPNDGGGAWWGSGRTTQEFEAGDEEVMEELLGPQEPPSRSWLSGSSLASEGHSLPPRQLQLQQQCQADAVFTRSEQQLLAAVSVATPFGAGSPSRARPASAPPHPAKSRSRGVHTNPCSSLAATKHASAGAMTGQQQQGVRGLDTISGVASNPAFAPAPQPSWGQAGGNVKSSGCGGNKVGTMAWQQRKPFQGPLVYKAKVAEVQRLPGRGLAHPQMIPAAAAIDARPAPREDPALPPVGPIQQQQQVAAAASSFLQPSPGALEGLLSSWRCTSTAIIPQSSAQVLQLETLERATFAQLKPGGLSRQQLQGARALGQVDSKFVPVVCGNVLALLDQHAADERVQLERLRQQVAGPGSRPVYRHALPLSTPQPLALTLAEGQLLEMFRDKARAWGWEWQQRGAGGQHILTHVPVVLGTALTGTDMKLFLHHLQDTCGAGGLPAGVVRVLNSKACRSAIMFGDELLPAQCQALVDDLKQTQLYNSCAHGRPTIAPLVDLQLLRQALRLRERGGLDGREGSPLVRPLAGIASRLRQEIEAC